MPDVRSASGMTSPLRPDKLALCASCLPAYASAATVVSALFTAPAQKRKRNEAAAETNSTAAGPAPASTAAGSSPHAATAAAEDAPAAKRAAVGAVRPAVRAAVGNGNSAGGAAHSRPADAHGIGSGSTRPEHAASDKSGPPHHHVPDAAAAAGDDDAADGSATDGGGASTRDEETPYLCESDPLAAGAAQLPFPPEHYVATIAELEVHEFPLPQAGADEGELVCPPGYVATRRRSACGSGSASESGVGLGISLRVRVPFMVARYGSGAVLHHMTHLPTTLTQTLALAITMVLPRPLPSMWLDETLRRAG